MRKAFVAALASLGATALLPATSQAAISRLELGRTAALGPQGTTVTVPVTYQCDFFDSNIGVTVHVAQSRGNRVADGFGFAAGGCTGTAQTLAVTVGLDFPPTVPYHGGKAVASVDAFNGFFASAGPTPIQINP